MDLLELMNENGRLRAELSDVTKERDEAREVGDRAAGAIGAMTIVGSDKIPRYRTSNNAPQQMPKRVQQKVTAFFKWVEAGVAAETESDGRAIASDTQPAGEMHVSRGTKLTPETGKALAAVAQAAYKRLGDNPGGSDGK